MISDIRLILENFLKKDYYTQPLLQLPFLKKHE